MNDPTEENIMGGQTEGEGEGRGASGIGTHGRRQRQSPLVKGKLPHHIHNS